jgi:hypothetical protein
MDLNNGAAVLFPAGHRAKNGSVAKGQPGS